VLLEIASFGTFLSFLKLGYFAFLRPGNTEASDPPVLMQVAMLGAAGLCILIGIYPQVLYGILPYPTTYIAYAPEHLASALLVLGAAALFFFAVGRKVLEPHEAYIRDFDVAYRALAHGITALAGILQALFVRAYRITVALALTLFTAGKYAMGMEDRDANWNLAMFGGVLVALVTVVILAVGL
jgi:multicomponent Na+:H+ antiporter subunit D